MNKLKRDMSRYPKKKDFDYSGEASIVNFEDARSKVFVNESRKSFDKFYNRLLGNKVPDQKFREVLKRYAEVMIQKRNILTMEINTDKDKIPFTIKVIGVLPEHVDACSNAFIKEDIDSNMLTQMIQDFKRKMRKYGISDAWDETYEGQHGKIVSIKRKLTNY
jgi:hypothetical protein